MAEGEQIPSLDMNTDTEKSLPSFIELRISGDEPTWCVDGRPDFQTPKGAQMLGGVLHPILLSAITHGNEISHDFVSQELSTLQQAGYTTGAHRGSHKNPGEGASDCGFADQLPKVFQTALKRKDEITARLHAIHEDNKDKIGDLGKPFSEIIENPLARLGAYPIEQIKLTGEYLLKTVEEQGAVIEEVQGDHAEEVAFVNMKKGTTFDTIKSNQQGRQAFNLDLWAAIEQSGKLGVHSEFAIGASLILYQATEMILVEDKGKPALNVIIN